MIVAGEYLRGPVDVDIELLVEEPDRAVAWKSWSVHATG
jgi:hypothetical protein